MNYINGRSMQIGENEETKMTLDRLCKMINLPSEVTEEVITYQESHESALDEELQKRLVKRDSWETAIEQLKQRIGEDPNGFFILSELLSYACKTYEQYQKLGIEDSVFIRTMEFCPRFINQYKEVYGRYAFVWAWWFPRQLAVLEFRIGELEYEFIDGDERFISIHIPGDARLDAKNVQKSFEEYRSFLEKYYPDWLDVDWYCESWMMSPALEKLLDDNSNVLQFNRLFEIESVDYDSLGALDWVYPGEKPVFEELSEKTSLQRKMKQFLLDGGKVGWAKAKLKRG